MKRNRYHIKIKEPDLSAEQIAQHKDFDALLDQFKAEEPTRKVSGWGGSGQIRLLYLVGSLAAMLVLYFSYQNLTSERNGVVAERPFIQPPLADVQAKFVSFEVDAYRGGVYEYDSGSRIVVPAGAFIGANGELVNGTVTMRYREFHDFVDFFLSGIPMTYDSASTRYNLESAGMMELYAEQSGKRVNLKPDKQISIELISALKAGANLSEFNIYKLDLQKKAWIYQGLDDIEFMETDEGKTSKQPITIPELRLKEILRDLEALQAEQDKQLKELELTIPSPKAPVSPKKAASDRFVFDLDIDKEEFPELAVYENTIWQLTDDPVNLSFNAGIYDTEWEDINIQKTPSGQHRLTLIKGTEELELVVEPVLSGNAYSDALKQYDDQLNLYRASLEDRDNRLEGERQKILAEMDRRRDILNQQKAIYEAELTTLKKSGNYFEPDNELAKKVVNRFSINSLGIWNCDRPLAPAMQSKSVKLVNQEGQEFLDTPAYFADLSSNTLTRFTTGNGEPLFIDTNAKLMFWLITDQGKLAIIKPDEFRQVNKDGDLTLILKIIDQPIQNEQDIRELLRTKSVRMG